MNGSSKAEPIASSVIVVDDDEYFRVAADAVLRGRLGVDDVCLCDSALAALDEIDGGGAFDLALVDLNMPGMDDRNLLDAIRAAKPDVRLVVVSASRSREDVLMALSAGVNGFVNKGMGIAELEAALRRVAEGSVYVPPFMTQPDEAPHPDEAGTVAEDAGPSLDAFTPRQVEVLRLVVAGQSNKEIARSLGISHGTVKFHLSVIFRTLGASNRVEAATFGAAKLRGGGQAE